MVIDIDEYINTIKTEVELLDKWDTEWYRRLYGGKRFSELPIDLQKDIKTKELLLKANLKEISELTEDTLRYVCSLKTPEKTRHEICEYLGLEEE